MSTKRNKKLNTFEESFKRLEKILEELESDDCSLERTIKLYEEAMTLAKFCTEKLNDAELKIKQINQNLKGEIKLKDLTKN